MNRRTFRAVATAMLLLAATAAGAGEMVMNMPVTTIDSRGNAVGGRIPVTVFTPPGLGPFPAVVVSHGRPGMPGARQRMGRVRLGAVATILLGMDMVVIVPTRLGYGTAAIGDPEYSVSCDQPQYERAFAAGADQVVAAVELARTLPLVDPERIYLVGYSVGGGVTAAAAARNLPGVRAAVNFSGAHGGRPYTHPGEPCRPDVLQQTFAGFGRTQPPVPQLWVYVENDEYIAPHYAKEWFDAFVSAGGQAKLHIVPQRRHGHDWFALAPAEWRGLVREFFGNHGLR